MFYCVKSTSDVYSHFSLANLQLKGHILQVISPTWKTSPPKNGSTVCAVERTGVALLEFALPMPGTGSAPGQKRYNWAEKEASPHPIFH